jgi:pimeloyl-ACP methyl ester carboxylesterase
MTIPTKKSIVETSHGALAVEEIGAGGLPLLLIHGNSSCRGAFRNQMNGQLAESHRLIAFDLPGHGESSDASDPSHSYTGPGLASAAAELLGKLAITECAVFGWSLRGHIGMELLHMLPGLRGLMITGTPPTARNGIAQGFLGSPHTSWASREHLSENEIEAFLGAIFGTSAEPFLREAMMRADGRFRKRLFEAARAGEGADQRLTVESSPLPVAVVNGAADRIVNLDYIDSVAFANLWEGRCHRLTGLGHAPFWEAPGEFNPLLMRFLQDLEARPR